MYSPKSNYIDFTGRFTNLGSTHYLLVNNNK